MDRESVFLGGFFVGRGDILYTVFIVSERFRFSCMGKSI